MSETRVSTPAQLESWLASAARGDRAIYCNGTIAGAAGGAMVRHVNELTSAGLVTPHVSKVNGAPVRIVMRTALGAPVREVA